MVNEAVLQKLIQVAKAKSTIQFVELGKVADMVLDNDEDIARPGRKPVPLKIRPAKRGYDEFVGVG